MPAATIALALSGAVHAAAEMAADGTTVELPKLTVEEQRRAVSSPKFTVPLVDTPQTISVITSDIYEAQGAATLSDVLRNTPGITFAAGEGGSVASGDSFYLRGSDASNSIFVDGVRDTGLYSRDTYNIEQVEIAKGPAGADTGRGGSSGYVNLVSKTPHIGADAGGLVSYGDAANGDPQKRATVDINQPLATGSAIRIAALWQDSGVPGRDYVNNSSWGISPSLAFGLGTETQVILAATYDKIDNLPDSGLPVVGLPGATLPGSVPISFPQNNYYGLPGADFDRTDRTSLTARIAHDFSGTLRLVNQTKWIDTERDALTSYIQNGTTTPTVFPPATTPVNPATGSIPPSYVGLDPVNDLVTPRRIHTDTINKIISNQTNLAMQFATGSLYHSGSAGLELSREEQSAPTWQPVGGPTTSIANPDPNRAVSVAQIPYIAANNPYAKGHIDTAAIYAFDTIQLTPHWLFNASLRLERYTIDYDSLVAATSSVPAPAVAEVTAGDTLFSWKTGLVYKPTPDGSLYVALADSFTPPGSSFVLSAVAGNQNNPNLAPQESKNYEIGAKWEFLKHRLSTSLAFYRSDTSNFTSTDAVTGLFTQDISQSIQGIEVGVSGKLNKNWLIFGGFGYIDSKYEASGTTAAINDGADLRFTPRFSGNFWTTYALVRHVTVGLGFNYTDSVVRSTANGQAPTNTTITSIPDYWALNLMVAYEINKHLTLRLNLNNVTDEASYRLNNNGGRYYPGIPRSYLLTADWKF
jgi:catecholate siderophore receptor